MRTKRLVLQLVAILVVAGGLVYFKTVREREAEENIGLIERRLEERRAAACACADAECKKAEREKLQQVGNDIGTLRVPGDREAAVRSSVNAKFDAAVACLRAPLPKPTRSEPARKRGR